MVDLAWLRSTPWRERVAAIFDPPMMRRSLGAIDKVVVRHRGDSTAAAVLFCGWLSSRLNWRPEALAQRGNTLTGHARAHLGSRRTHDPTRHGRTSWVEGGTAAPRLILATGRAQGNP